MLQQTIWVSWCSPVSMGFFVEAINVHGFVWAMPDHFRLLESQIYRCGLFFAEGVCRAGFLRLANLRAFFLPFPISHLFYFWCFVWQRISHLVERRLPSYRCSCERYSFPLCFHSVWLQLCAHLIVWLGAIGFFDAEAKCASYSIWAFGCCVAHGGFGTAQIFIGSRVAWLPFLVLRP